MSSITATSNQWLESLPAGWKVIPAKAAFAERRQRSKPFDVHLTPSQKYGVLPQIDYMQITGTKVVLNLEGQDNMKHVEADDFIIHLRSFQGGIERSKNSGKVSMAYTVLTPRTDQIMPGYFHWLLKADAYIQELRSTTDQLRDGQSIKYSTFSKIPLPLPPLDEQRAIADYLDRETAQIDALVAKQEELIRRLEERRLAVITTSVLTGLRDEESGEHEVSRWGSSLAVEPWLVRAPRSWGIERFKNVCMPRAERNVAGTEVMLSLTVKGYLLDRSSMAIQQNASDSSIPRYFVACPNDLVVNPMWLIGGAIGVSDKRGAVSPDYRVFQIDEVLDPWYLHAVLRSAPYFDQYTLYTRSNTTFDRRIKQNDLDNLPLPIPPIDEQREIVERIDEQTSRIDTLIAKAEEHIALAKERRSALITAAVTGQFDVRTARKAG